MLFEIAFNRVHDTKNNKEFYKYIGAEQIYSSDEYDYYGWFIELDSFEQLAELVKKINLYLTDGKNDFDYAAILSFDPNCIYLDKEV